MGVEVLLRGLRNRGRKYFFHKKYFSDRKVLFSRNTGAVGPAAATRRKAPIGAGWGSVAERWAGGGTLPLQGAGPL